MSPLRRRVVRPLLAALGVALAASLLAAVAVTTPNVVAGGPAAAAAAERPNLFIYHLDDLRDAFPGAVDPLQFMPKLRSWMADGRRYTQSFVADPSCCPSRSSMMTGRYPHNNGVLSQQDGAKFDSPNSMACYLQRAGYATYMAGKFLTTWPKTKRPPCFDHETVIWSGYDEFRAKVDGGPYQQISTYSTTYLGQRGRTYIGQALDASPTKPFLLYETPQAPHWVNVKRADGTVDKLAVPEAKYASTPVGTCSGVPEKDRSDKPAYVRVTNVGTARAQAICASQLRAIMTADDQFDATMQLLKDRGVLADTVVIFSSDNGYMWGEHGRWEKFVPYEPSIRVPLLVRWPGHVAAGTDSTRVVSLLDMLPTLLQAAGVTVPTTRPPLDGESLLEPSERTTTYDEYYVDTKANPNIPSWRMVRTSTDKYVLTYDATGAVIAREYYDLKADPAENLNLLGDGNAANDPPASRVTAMRDQLTSFATCAGAACVK